MNECSCQFAAYFDPISFQALTAKSTAHLNHCNADGYTPLHLACLSDKPDCVKALIQAGAQVNITARNMPANTARSGANSEPANISRQLPTLTNQRSALLRVVADPVAELLEFNTNKLLTQDMKHGGTPLHWSSSREVLLELVDRGCDVNAVNFEGKTALHVMVERNRLECVVALLSHEADIDVLDRDGNTPLHLAIAKKLVPIVQCLVVFGCDIDMVNRDGHSPRHLVGKDASGGPEDMILYILHSVGARRCTPNSSCPLGCNHLGTYNGIPPAQPESAENREHIYQVMASNSGAASTSSQAAAKQSRSGSLISSLVSLSGGATATAGAAPSVEATLVDVTAEQKGRNVMDALLGMFTSKVMASSPKNGECLLMYSYRVFYNFDCFYFKTDEIHNTYENGFSFGITIW